MKGFNTTWKELFKTKRILHFDKRWVRLRDLEAVLKELPKHIEQRVLGSSVEGRPIISLTVGSGPKHVLAWAAMHGNESTALRGWLDLFVNLGDESVNRYFGPLLEQFTVHFIPLLNPDGAERYTRRNAQGIDMNRDARALQSPEMQILLAQVKSITPDLAFNLHDQRNIFAVGGKPATISFLAPSIDKSRTITPERVKTMDLIATAANSIKPVLAGGIGRYTDEYYPTAIGECIQEKGIPTILVECGAAVDDPQRQQARMANPIILHSVLSRLLENDKPQNDGYLAISLNENKQVDVLIKGLEVELASKKTKADVALLAEECIKDGEYTCLLKVQDFGDLSHFTGLKTYMWKATERLTSTTIGQLADLEIEVIGGQLKIKNGVKA